MPTVYTIGYKGKSLEMFINQLRDARIDAVIDIRLRNTSHFAGYTTQDTLSFLLRQGFEIAYQEATSSGATSTAFKEAVLSLEVTPFITPDDRVIMDLSVSKDVPVFAAASEDGEPPISTSSVETSVLVDNGETVVLGGVYEKDSSTNNESIPFFGDLPYVGFMFNNDYEQTINKELLIFVTPKILKEELSLR